MVAQYLDLDHLVHWIDLLVEPTRQIQQEGAKGQHVGLNAAIGLFIIILRFLGSCGFSSGLLYEVQTNIQPHVPTFVIDQRGRTIGCHDRLFQILSECGYG